MLYMYMRDMCMYECLSACVSWQMHACMWRPEFDTECFLPSFSTLHKTLSIWIQLV